MLFIFDLDGTLVEIYGEDPLPGVVDLLVDLRRKGHSIALATNQAGPAWRWATGEQKYPAPMALGARFMRIAAHIPPLAAAPWFVAVGDSRLSLEAEAYERLIARFRLGAPDLVLHVSASGSWRKPEPGMLLAALRILDVPPEHVLFVGDSDTDAEAAANAHVSFMTAASFFAPATGD